jgi:hypothetical protein
VKRWLAVGLIAVVAALVWWWSQRERADEAPSTAASTGEGEMRSAQKPVVRTGDVRRGGRRIRGRVVVGDTPVAATVWIEMDHQPFASTTSGADGRFELNDLPAFRLPVSAVAPEHAGRTTYIDVRRGDQLDVVLRIGACSRVLVGTVTDEAGTPIEGARVSVVERLLNSAGFTSTGADGRYRICAENARVGLEVRAEGYASQRRVLSAGVPGAAFVLGPEGVLAGTTVDEHGAPVPFALVAAAPDAGTSSVDAVGASAMSDADGAYEIRGLGAGDFDVRARTETLASRHPAPVSIAIGEANMLDVVLHASGTIRGRATLADGRPAGDVEIVWVHHTGARTTARTDASGAFAITGAAYGKGTFFAIGYGLPKTPGIAGAAPVELVLPLLEAVKLKGRVTANGKPVADARVLDVARTDVDVARTGADGTFEFEHIIAPVVLVVESDTLGLASEPQRIELRMGETRDGIELELTRGGAVSGTVVDETGAPVANAAVTVMPSGAPHVIEGTRVRGQVLTGADGAFLVPMLTSGEHTIVVALRGEALSPVQGPRIVTLAGPRARIEGIRLVVALERAIFAGQVVDENGAPAADAELELRGGSDVLVRRADAAARFRFEASTAARYTLTARGAPGAEVTLDYLEPRTDLRLQLVAGGMVRVVCEPAGAAVEIFASTGPPVAARCGGVRPRVPVGEVFARFKQVEPGMPAPMAAGTVVAGSETTLALAIVEEREVELRLTRNGRPVAKAFCAIDHGVARLRTSPLLTADENGVVTTRVPKLPAQLRCTAQGEPWPRARTLAPDETRVSVEL